MKELTEDILKQVKNGWQAGIEENGRIAVFEIIARLGNQLKADEKWVLYPKNAGKEDGPATGNPRLFFELDTNALAYCHSPSNGQQYMIHSLISLYE